MDLERAMQFILELQAKHEQRSAEHEQRLAEHGQRSAEHAQRFAQIEGALNTLTGVVGTLADNVMKLDSALATLVDSQIQTEERFRATDERIEKLVFAVGALTRHLGEQQL